MNIQEHKSRIDYCLGCLSYDKYINECNFGLNYRKCPCTECIIKVTCNDYVSCKLFDTLVSSLKGRVN